MKTDDGTIPKVPALGPLFSEFPIDGARARRTDPDTSHEAAQALRSSARLGELQSAVLDVVRERPGSTSSEIFERLSSDVVRRDSITPRLAELRARGFVHNEPPLGEQPRKTDPATGRPVLRWWSAR